jgi:hypothetical protein
MLFASWIGGIACGGAVPLLHPAHTLPQGTITVGSGVVNQVALGAASRTIDNGKAAASAEGVAHDGEQAFVEGALIDHALSPGLSPWVGARLGLGSQYEAGMTYTGRSLRLDARHAFEQKKTALSIGLGLSAALMGSDPGSLEMVPASGDERIRSSGYDFSATGWGIDLPLLWGVRSSGHLFELWTGTRLGYERVFGNVILLDRAEPQADELSEPAHEYAEASVGRLYAEALVGLSVGVPPAFVRFEIGAGVHRMGGKLNLGGYPGDSKFREFDSTAGSLSTAGALVLEF